MNEAGTRAEHIDPALKAAGSGVVEGSRILRKYPRIVSEQVRYEVVTDYGNLMEQVK